MSDKPWPSVLRCSTCHAEQRYLRDQIIEKLGHHKMLRRNAEPAADLLGELWSAAVAKFACPECGKQSLHVAPDVTETDGWGEPVSCEVCGELIPRERLEVLPNVTLCATCQAKDDRGETQSEDVEYCPRCGNIMQVRQSVRGGLAGYRLVCAACRR